jgi:hypothetical protein
VFLSLLPLVVLRGNAGNLLDDLVNGVSHGAELNYADVSFVHGERAPDHEAFAGVAKPEVPLAAAEKHADAGYALRVDAEHVRNFEVLGMANLDRKPRAQMFGVVRLESVCVWPVFEGEADHAE